MSAFNSKESAGQIFHRGCSMRYSLVRSPRVGGFFAHVKAQIYFFEVPMAWNGQAADNCVIEEEANYAEVGFVVVEIDLGAGRHMRREDFRIDGEVEHGEVTPVRGQKRFQHRWRGRCQVGCSHSAGNCRRNKATARQERSHQRSEVRGQKSENYEARMKNSYSCS